MSGACVTGDGETEPSSSPVESLSYIGNANVAFACNNMHIIWNKTVMSSLSQTNDRDSIMQRTGNTVSNDSK